METGKSAAYTPTNLSTLFFQQFSALLRKNFLLSLRNKRATALQLASSLIFIFLLFCVDESIKANRHSTTYYKNLLDPQPTVVPAIPPCETRFYIKTPCYDFIWSGNSSYNVSVIVNNIMKNNPGRPIPSSKVLGFATTKDVNKWLLANRLRCTGALHFEERRSSVIAYGIQTNSTSQAKRGKYEDPTFKFQIPLQHAAEREIARFLLGDSSFPWSIAFKEFSHPALEVFSTVGTVGPTFLLAAVVFGFVIQMSNLVVEKELKLRQAMTVMGLMNITYWLSWLIWEIMMGLVSSILLVLFGMMFQFYFFINNNFGVLFFMFFLFQFNMTGLAFMLSTFVNKSSSARIVGFCVFIIGFLTQLVTTFGFPYDKSYAKALQVIWSIFPPNLFSIGLNYLGDATATKQDAGISWAGRTRCSSEDSDCVLTMDEIFKWLTATFFLWFFLAIYFDNILPDVNGVKKSWYFLLQPSYWTGKCNSQLGGIGHSGHYHSIHEQNENIQMDDDVAAEEALVQQQTSLDDHRNPDLAVQVCGLRKTFPGATQRRCCCKYQRTPPYHAIKGLWLNIEKDKLFCLLGPNGAGKTTTINCLTGIVPITSGDALVYGKSIRSPNGMSQIRKYMGVCPQFDLLWDVLTGYEHLQLFANIKGLQPSLIKSSAVDLLSDVKLTEAANMRAEDYSGGMKRRLSLAVALIGDPKLVYLDEPTTGMDPVTRRHVWDIIETAKKGRAIVLTTHSMEEADILSDRIAIMAKGKLRCIGTSIHLKSRFGTGYLVSVGMRQVNTSNGFEHLEDISLRKDHVKLFFKEHLDIYPKDESQTYIAFVIPREKENQLAEFFIALQQREEDFGISDIQISLTTLEDVFLNIAKQAELETAAAEGRFATVSLPNGTHVQVPIGENFVIIPETETSNHLTGMMIKLQWQQDDMGTLCLTGQSEPMPIT
eukprot:c28239_g1_i1 orf=514-3321(-)